MERSNLRRSLLALSLASLFSLAGFGPGCGDDGSSTFLEGSRSSSGAPCTGFGCTGMEDGGKAGCRGLECEQVDCLDPSDATTLTGTVYDPAGKVPVFNAVVYVPREKTAELGEISEGASCDRCDAKITGDPVVITTTDTSGNFVLKNVPPVDDLPLVIQIGKWRRIIRVPQVAKCASSTVDAALTRLPRNRSEGNIPRIALTTGAADALQCLLRKIGIDDSEFGIAGSDARVHLYQGGGYPSSAGPVLASSKFAGGATFPPAESLWNDGANLKSYDVVLLACEGAEDETTCPTCTGATKPDAAKTALYEYTKAGGRAFMSHYHEVWLRKNPDPAVSGIAEFAVDTFPPAGTNAKTTAIKADISSAFPKAQAMAEWLGRQGALENGKLPIYDARHDVNAVSSNALGWISVLNTATVPAGSPVNKTAIEYLSFNSPVGASDADVCGRVVLSDIHVAAGATPDDPTKDFPSGCNAEPLNAQQKALEFMLFDLSSCVQRDEDPLVQPK